MWASGWAVPVLALAGVLAASGARAAAGGAVELDEFSFEKVASKFEATLVKFDVAFPYGDKHDAYAALAREARGSLDLLVAEVGVKDYGEKDNEALAAQYGASKDNFPQVKLFLKGKPEPVTFTAENGFTTDELRRFVRDNTGLYLSLPGCVEALDRLGMQFMQADKQNRGKLMQKVEEAEKNLPTKDVASGKIYKLIMQRVIDKGDEFIDTEYQRVQKLSAAKVSDEKKKELNTRLNILRTFRIKQHAKEEL